MWVQSITELLLHFVLQARLVILFTLLYGYLFTHLVLLGQLFDLFSDTIPLFSHGLLGVK